jgi:hypothetical protein
MSRVAFTQHCEFHGDIPTTERAKFTQNEQAWALQADLSEDYLTDPPFKSSEKWIPIGVSDRMAMGFGTSLAPAHRQRSMLLEQDQFAKVWINTLLRTHYRQQYNGIHERFLKMVKKDPSLKTAAEMVLRCKQLLEFRDKLPAERSDDMPQGLDNAIAERYDGRYRFADFQGVTSAPEETELPKQKVALYTFDYREPAKNAWKVAMIFKCHNDTLPTACLTRNNHLYVAYYVSEQCVKMMHFDENQQVVDSWYTEERGMRGPLTCDVDAVTDGHLVYEKCGRKHWIEKDVIITSIKRAETTGDLYLGTFAGHVYNVTQLTFVKTRDPLAVLSIDTSGDNKYIIQSINDITFDERLLNVGRPLTCAVKGTMVVSLSKYGVISLCFMGANSFYPAPEGVTGGLRYYKGGIWISDDGGKIVVMYPDGRVGVKKL